MYKTEKHIEGLAQRKQQKWQKVILHASHWLCVNVLLNIVIFLAKSLNLWGFVSVQPCKIDVTCVHPKSQLQPQYF